MMVAAEQADNGLALYVDVEHSLDPTYASKLGVDVPNLLVSQPDYGEQALGIVEAMARSGAVSIIVVDSVSALVPKAELDGDMGDSHMGLQARLMSQAMRKLCGVTSKSGTTIIFINQIREKIGVMFGSPETTSGGRALKFYASVRLDIRRRETIKEGEQDIGFKMEIKAIKNKVGIPKKSTTLDLYYPGASDTVGFDKMGDLLNYAVHEGVVEKSGAWYAFKGERIGQGFDKARGNMVNFEVAVRKALKEKA
jgi:recombination protein RecA